MQSTVLNEPEVDSIAYADGSMRARSMKARVVARGQLIEVDSEKIAECQLLCGRFGSTADVNHLSRSAPK